MDGELLRSMYHRLFHSPIAFPPPGCTYSDAIIVFIDVFASLCQQSHHWACDKRNWPPWTRRLKFPSYSQFKKRFNDPHAGQLIDEINQEFCDQLPHSHEKFCDGKALVIGGFSKDPDARRGKVPAGWAKGYKMHAIVDSCGAIDAFEVTDLACGESTIARRLIKHLDLTNVLLRGDSNYDSNLLYRDVADRDGRLRAPRKKPFTRLGHRTHHPHRLQAITLLEASEQAMNEHERHRIRVEQSFAHLTNMPFGLFALPNFVRRRHRVRQWIRTKIMLYHLHRILFHRQHLAA
ncbi:MAG: transposase [Chthoniobacterales bacterium]|nr:transposase [Chthoniobacterales bacterium]